MSRDFRALLPDDSINMIWDAVSGIWNLNHKIDSLTPLYSLNISEIEFDQYLGMLDDVLPFKVNKNGEFEKVKLKREQLKSLWFRNLHGAIGYPTNDRTLNNLESYNLSDLKTLRKNCLGKQNLKDPARRNRAKLICKGIDLEYGRRAKFLRSDPEDYFSWPTTDVVHSSLRGELVVDWREEGLLSYLGYHVGATKGILSSKRCEILSSVFEDEIPPAFDIQYLDEWGEPSSPCRLKKLAECIASFARNAKRNQSSNLSDAIRDWEADLLYLYNKYYRGHFNFDWPST